MKMKHTINIVTENGARYVKLLVGVYVLKYLRTSPPDGRIIVVQLSAK